MPVPFDRRRFLRGAGAASVTAAAMTAAPWLDVAARAEPDPAPFQWGVGSGDPLHDRVILWTRVDPALGASVEVTWRISPNADVSAPVASGTATASAGRDHTVKVDAAGLDPATTYFYVFEAGGKTSAIGRTRTAPRGAVGRLRFGMVSCSNYQHGFFHAYRHLAERDDLDAVLHLGDYIYEYQLKADGGYGEPEENLDEPRRHDPPTEILTVDDYRRRYAQYRLDPDLKALHRVHPFIHTWDDHEITNDSWREGAENHDEGEGDYQVRKRIAFQVFDEWLPVRIPEQTRPVRIWRDLPYGDLLDIVVMDTRIDDRDEPASGILEGLGDRDPVPVLESLFDPEQGDRERTMISAEQLQLVHDRLANSPTTWTFLAQQVMMMPWKAGGFPSGFGGQDAPAFVTTPGGSTVNGDAWDAYFAERDRILSFLQAGGIDGTVVLTGDIHSSWAADLPPDPFDPSEYDGVTQRGSVAVEFVCPSVTSASFYKTLGGPYRGPQTRAVEEATKAANPHIKFLEGDTHGYVILDVTPDQVQADFWWAHPVETREHIHELGASWRTLAGANHVEEAPAGTADGPAAPRPADEPAPAPTSAPPPAPAAPSLPTTGGGAAVAGTAALAAAGLLHLRTRAPRD